HPLPIIESLTPYHVTDCQKYPIMGNSEWRVMRGSLDLSPRSSAGPIAGIDSLQPEDVEVICWRYVRLVSTPRSQLHSSLVSPEPSHPARSRARAPVRRGYRKPARKAA